MNVQPPAYVENVTVPYEENAINFAIGIIATRLQAGSCVLESVVLAYTDNTLKIEVKYNGYFKSQILAYGLNMTSNDKKYFEANRAVNLDTQKIMKRYVDGTGCCIYNGQVMTQSQYAECKAYEQRNVNEIINPPQPPKSHWWKFW